MKFARTFNGTIGEASIGLGGPDQIEADLDSIAKNLDPLQPGGGIGTENMQAGAVTDTIVGERTLTDTVAPTTETGLVGALLGGLAYMVKAITGQANWRTAPDKTLADVYAKTDVYTQDEINAIVSGIEVGVLGEHSITPAMLRQDLFDFDNWAYALGGTKTTSFGADITETITVSSIVVATKVTSFGTDITETVTYAGHTYQKITSFGTDITETITEV